MEKTIIPKHELAKQVTVIEKQITAEEPLVVRWFLSWQLPLGMLFIGVPLVAATFFKQHPLFAALNPDVISVAGIVGMIFVPSGIIMLANRDWSWGRPREISK